ncbi:MAG TPA: protein kinase, partial [Vicinamibacterales bacterium]|nr:protein kinase [Vicinamibacterales bacterium]
FEGEARSLSATNHPNICTIYEIGVHDERPFLAMELLEGEPLHHAIARGPVPIDLILEVGIKVADALDAAHQAGFVHRDVKPANIFITTRGQVKVFDFGLAKPIGDPASGETPLPALTQTGLTMGTVSYMSPEQARGERLDGRSDVFSLGLVLHEMATGEQTFGGGTAAVVFDALLNRPPMRIAPVNPGVPQALEDVITRALEKDPNLRYQAAADLRDDLQRLRRDVAGNERIGTSAATVLSTLSETVTPASWAARAVEPERLAELRAAVKAAEKPPPAPAAPGRARRLIPWMAAAVVVVAGAVGVAMWQAGSADTPRRPAAGDRPSETAVAPAPGEESTPLAAALRAGNEASPAEATGDAAAAEPPAAPAATGAAPAIDGSADLAVIRAKVEHKLYDEAVADGAAFATKYPASPLVAEAAFLAADARRLAGHMEAARGAFVEFGTRYPGSARSAEALYRLAELTAASKTPTSGEDARRLYGEVASRFVFNARWAAPALFEKSLIEERLKVREIDQTLQTSVPSALVTLRRLTTRYPTSPAAEAAWWRLADHYQGINRHVHAAEACVSLASSFPSTRHDAWFRAGEIYEKKVKDKERARAAYAKVPPTSPKYNEAKRKAEGR